MPVRMATGADLADLEVAFSTAFLHDPMMTWVAGEPHPERRHAAQIAGFFRPSLQAGLRRGHTYMVHDEAGSISGGSLWCPPDVPIFTDDEAGTLGMAMHEHMGDEALGRLMALGELVGLHHPHDRPHFYLFLVGAVEQGRGVGAQVLQPVLERCDADGLPAYLESSTARNLGFYRRLGFEVQWEAAPADDGPIMRGMWRDPGSVGRGE